MQHAFPTRVVEMSPAARRALVWPEMVAAPTFSAWAELGGGALTGGEPEQIGAGAAEQPDEGSVPDDSRTGSGAAAG